MKKLIKLLYHLKIYLSTLINMGSAVSVVEAVGLETSVEAFGQISDAGELALADDRKRDVVGIGTCAVAGGMMDLVLATSAIAT